ncbi:MAG: Crp/Fnr family transcriptional regulator [Myxococcaceae bacterium]|nr:Crp/Fnr family transcriptional regulator [Myxococcaceae bacterium]
MFSAFDERDLRALASVTRVKELEPGEALWTHGDDAEWLGGIVSGPLKLTRPQQRREILVEVLGPGALVGDVAFSLRAPYPFDVVSLRRARVLLVPVRVLRNLLAQRPKAAVALTVELAKQVMQLTRRVETLTAGTVEQRLALALVGLADRFGEAFPGGVLVPLRLRRQDLASLAATTLETTSRRLTAWKRRGIVLPQPAGYLVRDLAALRRITE